MLDGIICIYILYRQEDVYVIDCPLVELVGGGSCRLVSRPRH